VARRVVVSGQVQGVFFRDTCRREAARHAVTGWVRNCPDGTVEAVFEGPEDAVAAMVAWARRGPAHAVVHDVQTFDETPEGRTGFAVR
jgi:acylphosphatase